MPNRFRNSAAVKKIKSMLIELFLEECYRNGFVFILACLIPMSFRPGTFNFAFIFTFF